MRRPTVRDLQDVRIDDVTELTIDDFEAAGYSDITAFEAAFTSIDTFEVNRA